MVSSLRESKRLLISFLLGVPGVAGAGALYFLKAPGTSETVSDNSETIQTDKDSISSPISEPALPSSNLSTSQFINNSNVNTSTTITQKIRELYRGHFKLDGSEDYLISDVEKLRASQPLQWQSYYGNKRKKQSVSLASAKEKAEVLMDYSLSISLKGCEGGSATGWILDYVLPDEKKGETYPTTFFIATNAHVVNVFNWDKSNPYKQVLSLGTQEPSWQQGEGCYESGGGATFMKEKVKHGDEDFDRTQWHRIRQSKSGGMYSETFDLNTYVGGSQKKHDYRTPYGLLSDLNWRYHLKNPKLVYLPWNFMGTDSSKWGGRTFNVDYYLADFAVLELNFENENMARWFTKDFYNKYDAVKGYKKDQALNFFAEPLAKKYTKEQLSEKDIRFWVAGYPINGLPHKATSNYIKDKQMVSGLTYYQNGSIKWEDGQHIVGHTDWSDYHKDCKPQSDYDCASWTWDGKKARFRGYGYVYGNMILSEGSSGSLVVAGTQENGVEMAKDVLGLHSMKFRGGSGGIGISVALRNMEIRDSKGTVVSPAYDFIEGAPGQNGSYKDQIKTYVLSKGKQTALSRLRKWK